MNRFGRNATEVLLHPRAFALAVLKQFRANQGLLLAGAVAYYALLSLVPLLILIVLALTRVFDETRVLDTIGAYLEFFVPGQSSALVGELRNFLAHRELVGWLLLVLMLFFSTLAFTVLENAMSVIFFHRVAVRRRHFLVSAVMPYLFILLLAVGLLIITVVSGALNQLGTRSWVILGEAHPLGEFSARLLYLIGVAGEIFLLTAIYMVMPVGRLRLRHALIGAHGGDAAVGDNTSRAGLVLLDHIADSGRLRLTDDIDRGFDQRGGRRHRAVAGSTGHRRVRAHRPRADRQGAAGDEGQNRALTVPFLRRCNTRVGRSTQATRLVK